MGGSMILLIGLAVGAFMIIVLIISIYNGLVGARQIVRNAWSQIDVQLKRRHDLIPNLVETVKGYATHEKSTLENVTQARNQAIGAKSIGEKMQAESQLTGALGRLLVTVEAYPDLKANTNFLALQEELTSTENKIGFSRQHYNDAVMAYNTRIQQIPANIIAGMFNFKDEPFFEIQDQAERETPQVKF